MQNNDLIYSKNTASETRSILVNKLLRAITCPEVNGQLQQFSISHSLSKDKIIYFCIDKSLVKRPEQLIC